MPDDDAAPYKVWVFLIKVWHECVGEDLDAREAVELAKRQTETVGARLGTTRRVIIEDSGGHTAFEWRYGKGITFPKIRPSSTVGNISEKEKPDGEPAETVSSARSDGGGQRRPERRPVDRQG